MTNLKLIQSLSGFPHLSESPIGGNKKNIDRKLDGDCYFQEQYIGKNPCLSFNDSHLVHELGSHLVTNGILQDLLEFVIPG